jgi:hypothetical protein
MISNSHYQNWFVESPPTSGFQQTNFGVFSAKGAENTKIGLIMLNDRGGASSHHYHLA